MPEENWIVSAGCHDAIISMEEFETVQNQLSIFSAKRGVFDRSRPLWGKVKCGVCKHSLNRKKKPARYYCTNRYVLSKAECMKNHVLESELESVILCMVRVYADIFLDANTQLKNINWYEEEKRAAPPITLETERTQLPWNRIKELRHESQKLKILKLKLYEEMADGKISREIYGIKQAEVCRKEEEINDEIKDWEKKISRQQTENDCWGSGPANINLFETGLTKAAVTVLINAVYVYSDCSIEIKWNNVF